MTKRKIYLIGIIDSDMYTKFTEELDVLIDESKRKPIHIELCSYGGDDTMYAFYDKIVNCKTPIHIYAYGMVQSAAVLVFAAGHIRDAAPNTQFMVHETSTKLKGETSNFKRHAEQLSKDEEKYCKLIESRCGITQRQPYWRALCKETTYFTSLEATKWGLINAK